MSILDSCPDSFSPALAWEKQTEDAVSGMKTAVPSPDFSSQALQKSTATEGPPTRVNCLSEAEFRKVTQLARMMIECDSDDESEEDLFADGSDNAGTQMSLFLSDSV
mmetsp:Transcript_70331/g.126769  ORF Transcript_70331/g.126769 Transcript_70331/m.126769 type:complete len:107 (+) Transcript_70331:125-445(+)|eukprot:CAMPEP_0115138028 /NCGR_PEP_ID=MMETSP0227-20121206/57411_1 /TAXON_ID=89957 /ORGANISM="Polarella glacialis, Strain CCMP 1383" /LENGTH=106 /DNA_ID=CAMNT_0002545547 /DNA_START=124 /DNA_END=444 /DNA_ORIENTATION=-